MNYITIYEYDRDQIEVFLVFFHWRYMTSKSNFNRYLKNLSFDAFELSKRVFDIITSNRNFNSMCYQNVFIHGYK